MSKKFVRSTKDVKDIEKFSKNMLEENDIVSTQDGKVYIVTKDGFLELGFSDSEQIKNDIKSINSIITNIDKSIKTLKTDISKLQTDYKTLSERVTALETPSETE